MFRDDGATTQGGVSKIVEMLEQLGIQEDIKQISSWSGYHLEQDVQTYSHYSTNEPMNSYLNAETRFEDDSQTSSIYCFDKMEIFKEKESLHMAVDFTFNPSFQASNGWRKDSWDNLTSGYLINNCSCCQKQEFEEHMVKCVKCNKLFCKACYQIKDFQTMIQTITCTSCELSQ